MKTFIKYLEGSALDRNRTCDLPLRRRLLYPTELRGQCVENTTLSDSALLESQHCILQGNLEEGAYISDLLSMLLRMRIYDTMSNQIRDLEPKDPHKVSIYACGPTVQDVPHLGHARTALTYDVLKRYLVVGRV